MNLVNFRDFLKPLNVYFLGLVSFPEEWNVPSSLRTSCIIVSLTPKWRVLSRRKLLPNSSISYFGLYLHLFASLVVFCLEFSEPGSYYVAQVGLKFVNFLCFLSTDYKVCVLPHPERVTFIFRVTAHYCFTVHSQHSILLEALLHKFSFP